MKNNLLICSRCILDSSVLGIVFDDDGVCNFCKIPDKLEERLPLNEFTKQKLNQIFKKLKYQGRI